MQVLLEIIVPLENAFGVLGQPVGTVKSNVHRALKLLRGENHDRAND